MNIPRSFLIRKNFPAQSHDYPLSRSCNIFLSLSPAYEWISTTRSQLSPICLTQDFFFSSIFITTNFSNLIAIIVIIIYNHIIIISLLVLRVFRFSTSLFRRPPFERLLNPLLLSSLSHIIIIFFLFAAAWHDLPFGFLLSILHFFYFHSV